MLPPPSLVFVTARHYQGLGISALGGFCQPNHKNDSERL